MVTAAAGGTAGGSAVLRLPSHIRALNESGQGLPVEGFRVVSESFLMLGPWRDGTSVCRQCSRAQRGVHAHRTRTSRHTHTTPTHTHTHTRIRVAHTTRTSRHTHTHNTYAHTHAHTDSSPSRAHDSDESPSVLSPSCAPPGRTRTRGRESPRPGHEAAWRPGRLLRMWPAVRCPLLTVHQLLAGCISAWTLGWRQT